jgi:hypothetical protein
LADFLGEEELDDRVQHECSRLLDDIAERTGWRRIELGVWDPP